MATNPRATQDKTAQLAALQREFNTYILNTDLKVIKEFANKTLFPIFETWEKNAGAQEDFRGWVKTQGAEKEARFNLCLTLFQERQYLNGFVLNEDAESESDDDEFMQHLVTSAHKPPQLGVFGTAVTYVGLGNLFGYQPHTPPTTPPQTLAKRSRIDSLEHQPAVAQQLFPATPTPPNAEQAARERETQERLIAQQQAEQAAREREAQERLIAQQQAEQAAREREAQERLIAQQQAEQAAREREAQERLIAQQQAEQAAREREAQEIKRAEEARRMEASRKAAEDLQRQQAEQQRQQTELLFKQQQEQQAREAAARKATEDAAQREAARIAELRRQMAIEGF